MNCNNSDLINKIYSYIESYYIKNECSPSVQMVATKENISKSTAHKYIKILEEQGKLVQAENNRGYRPTSTKQIISNDVPQVGSIPCGSPVTEEQNIERYLQFPTWFFKTKNPYFCLIANGDSMIGAGISEGDLVLVRQQEDAQEGDIVVALTEEGESTLKRLKFDRYREKVVLHPENPKYHDIYCDSIKVQGVVEKVIKDY